MNSSEEYFVASFAVMHQQIKLINHVLEELSMRLEEIEEVITENVDLPEYDEDLLSRYVFTVDEVGEEEPIHEGFEPVQALYDDPSNAPNTYESEKGEYESSIDPTIPDYEFFAPKNPVMAGMEANEGAIRIFKEGKWVMLPKGWNTPFTLPRSTESFISNPTTTLWTSGMGDGYAHTRKKGAPKDYRMD